MSTALRAVTHPTGHSKWQEKKRITSFKPVSWIGGFHLQTLSRLRDNPSGTKLVTFSVWVFCVICVCWFRFCSCVCVFHLLCVCVSCFLCECECFFLFCVFRFFGVSVCVCVFRFFFIRLLLCVLSFFLCVFPFFGVCVSFFFVFSSCFSFVFCLFRFFVLCVIRFFLSCVCFVLSRGLYKENGRDPLWKKNGTLERWNVGTRGRRNAGTMERQSAGTSERWNVTYTVPFCSFLFLQYEYLVFLRRGFRFLFLLCVCVIVFRFFFACVCVCISFLCVEFRFLCRSSSFLCRLSFSLKFWCVSFLTNFRYPRSGEDVL